MRQECYWNMNETSFVNSTLDWEGWLSSNLWTQRKNELFCPFYTDFSSHHWLVGLHCTIWLSYCHIEIISVAVEASSENCQAQETTFSQVCEYVSALAASRLPDWKCLRVDLMIVASTKQVHHATFYPSTGFGSTSSFNRTADGHLSEIETFTSGENNIFKLFDQDISGSHTLEISNSEQILLTACLCHVWQTQCRETQWVECQ